MLESAYINGIEIPPFDKKITEIIDSYSNDGDDDGNVMVVGIQNLEGDVYRVIHATGLGAYITITSQLSSLGLVDELAESYIGQNGLDSLFFACSELRRACIDVNPQKTLLDEIEEQSAELQLLDDTERQSIVQCKIGQGSFRESLIDYWQGCAVTECQFPPLLKASHIKPWCESSNEERLDVFNGFLCLQT